jgi:hypothetical protein
MIFLERIWIIGNVQARKDGEYNGRAEVGRRAGNNVLGEEGPLHRLSGRGFEPGHYREQASELTECELLTGLIESTNP